VAIPKERIVKVVKEKRTSQVARGVKQGMIKSTVDRVVEQNVTPLADKITPKLHEMHPGMQLADPVIKSVLEFALLNALAEILEVGGPLITKAPGVNMSHDDAVAKTQALALWMRNYSGEKMGEQVVEAAIQIIPLFKDMLSQTDLSELLNAAEDVSHGQSVEHSALQMEE
jgi:hypothetical protein